MTLSQFTTDDYDETREAIRDYSVDVQHSGQAWTDTELFNIRAGITRTAEAFGLVGVGDTPQNRFVKIMAATDAGHPADLSYLVFLRLSSTIPNPLSPPELQYYYSGTADGYCQYFDPVKHNINQPNEIRYPRLVACRGFLIQSDEWQTGGIVKEEATNHELGHVFDGRTGLTLRNNIQFNLSETPPPNVMSNCGFELDEGNYVIDPQTGERIRNERLRFPIMGHSPTWTRGGSGWGSTHGASLFSQFQQNGKDTPYEAVGDMFLNWVYRRTTSTDPNPLPGDPCGGPAEVGTGIWQGFLNIDRTGLFDPHLPGNVRYWWMDTQVINLLIQFGWRE